MKFGRNYYTLLASLPHLPVHFDVERPPISRSDLTRRLEMLGEDDRHVIRQLTQFFVWDRQPLERTDDEVCQTYLNLNRDIRNSLALKLMDHRIDMRTIVAAIRRKRSGSDPPTGVRKLTDEIRRNWNQPGFSLIARYPWIEPFSQAFDQGHPRQAQRVLFQDLWTTWKRLADMRFFCFESVILYLARWEILDRWTSQNHSEGERRFHALLTETMGKYANIY
ncbi:MAG: DUF2764 family protein [Planctomycetaceae bacterium]